VDYGDVPLARTYRAWIDPLSTLDYAKRRDELL
jgi:hypothetical protein